ncbi:hypothetical protein FJU08_05335 [Martelella alba]|uniref:Uncharacterized protein n=1 Tax=Martelella alba TaxID=2590451 RepID=A0A506UGA4_9HYPH|nr:hypothetical protein [Martelella alba]TPW32421.1 hypothetical protein FJU08_05335 [Martelella alba]
MKSAMLGIVLFAASITSFAAAESAQLSSGTGLNSVEAGDDLLAVTCLRKDEEVSGRNKICYYDCLGSRTAVTIKSTQPCPLTIDH